MSVVELKINKAVKPETDESGRQYFSVVRFAKYLGTSEARVRVSIMAGLLNSHVVNRQRRIYVEDAEMFLKNFDAIYPQYRRMVIEKREVAAK